MLIKGAASLEVKNSERDRELENFASLEPRVCEVLLYSDNFLFGIFFCCNSFLTSKILAHLQLIDKGIFDRK